jgi:nitrite reductase/ring-hydroxylating ferredoxin subunit
MYDRRWLRVCAEEDLPPGAARQVRVLARAVAVFNVDGRLWAVDGLCRHMKAPLVFGALEGPRVTCHWHGWQYDVTDGRCLNQPGNQARLRTFETRIENGAVLVDITPLYRDRAQSTQP